MEAADKEKKSSKKIHITHVPSEKDFEDVTRDTGEEKDRQKSALQYRNRLKKAYKDGDSDEIVRLMKVRKLETIVQRREDDFVGEKTIKKSTLSKYNRAPLTSKSKSKKVVQNKMSVRVAKRVANTKAALTNAVKQAARSEFILPEESGFLEADEGETTADVSQHDLVKSVDLQTAQKHFTLNLREYGSYSVEYSRNGRYLALASSLGHSAVVDWQPKTLKAEFNVKETIHDVKYLHNETMLAVAQRQWTYIYDNEGIELHCLKALDAPIQLQFLPFHFLLASSNAKGHLSWLDVSIGEKVMGFQTHRGRLNIMAQNPTNAIVHLGHSRGTVSLWSPNSKEPLVDMLCHNAAVRSVCVDKTGRYMATSGLERKIKIWDLRTYKCMHEFKVPSGAGSMNFSSRGLLAAGMGNTVSVYKDVLIKPPTQQYMSHTAAGSVRQVLFCPYEDVLGVGSSAGFESILVPGSGEPNFDAMESNPFQTKKQRQNQEVKQLLDKIPSHLISLNHESIKDLQPTDAVIPEKNGVPKRWLKYHYIPSKSIMETKRRRELQGKLAKEKKERHKKIQEEKSNPKPYNPLDRFKFGG